MKNTENIEKPKNTEKPTCHNKHQHKLIVLTSTINYVNLNFEQYTQNKILHYFNNNLKNNEQKEVKIKTLQNYLYKLEKELKVTNNYYKHLGVNMGTEVYYELRYSKKECYRKINKYFKDKKNARFKSRVQKELNQQKIKNGSVELKECNTNIYNNKEEERQKIEKLQTQEKNQIKKYAEKCDIKYNLLSLILNLNICKIDAIEIFKAIKRDENQMEKKTHNKANIAKKATKKIPSRITIKQEKLNEVLKDIKTKLESKGYDRKMLEVQIKKIYEKYKNKPHFIIENEKYEDLNKIINKLKKSIKCVKKDSEEEKKNTRINIFSILFDRFKYKLEVNFFVPILRDYLNKQEKLEYNKVFNDHYYNEILELIKNKKDSLNLEKNVN
ncbi:plasmid maintenance protein [Borrelia persica]|uniref:plasmid maintenance protein n=1 Tax=Borrelia persica TaxID=44448 RepID=UPI000465262A|nr:plasmid maintenance protein [Borrelia persica]